MHQRHPVPFEVLAALNLSLPFDFFLGWEREEIRLYSQKLVALRALLNQPTNQPTKP